MSQEQEPEVMTRREGFGGRTSTTWAAKWRSGQTAPIRLPKLLHDSLTELARQADQQPDPIAWLQSLQPAQQPALIKEGEWDRYNVAQLRQIARDRGLKTARAANRAQLLDFLNQEKKGV